MSMHKYALAKEYRNIRLEPIRERCWGVSNTKSLKQFSDFGPECLLRLLISLDTHFGRHRQIIDIYML